jgi:sporulation protein YlmC with PRC-barrel domain
MKQSGNGHKVKGVLSATTMVGDGVRNELGEDLGKVEEIMIDYTNGRIAYAVLSFGGFLGLGNKLFAVPWEALTLDTREHKFTLNVPKDKLERAPGFDKDNWPDMADPTCRTGIYDYYGCGHYWVD